MSKERVPRQIPLTQAHPGGYLGYWGKEQSPVSDLLHDPEAGLANLHDKKERQKLISADVSHWWRQQLKKWGYTTAERNERMRRKFQMAIDRLKKEGVWDMIVKRSTIEELEAAREILANSKDPIRIEESSENLTFYPDEVSWWKDVYGTVPKEVLIKELTG